MDNGDPIDPDAALQPPFPPAPVAVRLGLLALHAAMLVACYRVDRRVCPREHVAAWLPLRLRLTVAATLCCPVAAVAG